MKASLYNCICDIFQLGQSISELSIKDEKSPGRGRYDERYVTLDSIGKGAFGFVKLAKRKSDNREVCKEHK